MASTSTITIIYFRTTNCTRLSTQHHKCFAGQGNRNIAASGRRIRDEVGHQSRTWGPLPAARQLCHQLPSCKSSLPVPPLSRQTPAATPADIPAIPSTQTHLRLSNALQSLLVTPQTQASALDPKGYSCMWHACPLALMHSRTLNGWGGLYTCNIGVFSSNWRLGKAKKDHVRAAPVSTTCNSDGDIYESAPDALQHRVLACRTCPHSMGPYKDVSIDGNSFQ